MIVILSAAKNLRLYVARRSFTSFRMTLFLQSEAPLIKGDFTVLNSKAVEDIGTILFDEFLVAIERVVIAAGDAV